MAYAMKKRQQAVVPIHPTSTLTSIGRLNWVRFSGRGHPRWTLF